MNAILVVAAQLRAALEVPGETKTISTRFNRSVVNRWKEQ